MNCSFEKVINGLSRYINSNIYTDMSDLQELIARVAVGRVIERSDDIKNLLIKNGMARTFGIIDSEGMIDIDGLMNDIKKQISHKERLEISIPLLGTFKFVPEDIDVIHRFIMEG
jgi:hypothetical protein